MAALAREPRIYCIALLAVVALCACGSLEEMVASRADADGGGVLSTDGGPTSPLVDSSAPQPTGDGGAVGAMDAHSPAVDAAVSDSGAAVDAGTAPPALPKRVVFIYTAHGFTAAGRSPDEWKPSGSRDPMTLSGRLAPLMPFRDRMVLVDGLNAAPVPTDPDRRSSCAGYRRVSHGCDGHFFGGSHPELTRSPDDRLAWELQDGTLPADPLVLGLVGTPWCGCQSATLPRISINDGGSPRAVETSAISFLDGLLQRTDAITAPSAAAADQLRQLQSGGASIERAEGTVRAQFFLDGIAAELAYDTVRVATFVLGHNDLFLSELVGSRSEAGFLNPPTLNNTGHQSPDQFERYQRWFVEEVARFAHTLDRIPEGGGTVLDHTLIVWFTDSGEVHNSIDDVPVFLLGGALPTLPFGRYITVDDGRLIDLFMTIGVGFGMAEGTMGYPSAPGRVLPELVR